MGWETLLKSPRTCNWLGASLVFMPSDVGRSLMLEKYQHRALSCVLGNPGNNNRPALLHSSFFILAGLQFGPPHGARLRRRATLLKLGQDKVRVGGIPPPDRKPEPLHRVQELRQHALTAVGLEPAESAAEEAAPRQGGAKEPACGRAAAGLAGRTFGHLLWTSAIQSHPLSASTRCASSINWP